MVATFQKCYHLMIQQLIGWFCSCLIVILFPKYFVQLIIDKEWKKRATEKKCLNVDDDNDAI